MPEEFDEALYLSANPDVAAAVRSGDYRDGYEHWIRFGRKEFLEGRRQLSTQSGIHAFRITLGARGDVLAAPLSQALAFVERASLRLDNRSVTLDPAHVIVSEEFEVLDEAGRAHAQWFVLLWVPAGMILENGQAPGAITLVMTAAGGEVRTVSFAGLAAQPPSFTSIDSANAFVLASKRLGRAVTAGAALAVEVGKFACAQLKPPPEHVDQPYSNLHIEHVVGIEGIGIYVCGWLIPANPSLERCRAWCPETGEHVELSARLLRYRRADVWQVFKEKLDTSASEQFGFVALLDLPEASRLPECHFVIGITPKGGAERISSPTRSKPARDFVDAAKLVLANLNLSAANFEALMTSTIGPAIDALWARERSRKSRNVMVREFGERPLKPDVSVIVPVYGRSDLIRYQLALFANDTAFKSGSIELIYFIDDPRLIEDTLQLCEGWSSLSRVPMLLAYTGENHGFSGANNLAASVARGDFLVLLNSDVMPKRPGWVHQLMRAHAALPECGVLGAKLLYHDESLQHDGMVFERFPFWNGLYGNNHPGKGLPNWSELDAPPREVEGVTGACLGIARGLFAKLGGLCEDFVFGDFEDSELCLRVRNAGKRVYYAPGVELYHLERQSQSLLPDGESWRWQLTVYNSWLQDKRWRAEIDDLKRASIPRRTRGRAG